MCLLAACSDGELGDELRKDFGATSGETGGPDRATAVKLALEGVPPPRPAVSRTPESCPHVFQPSLVPVPAPAVNGKNSARRVRTLRQRLERIDVIEVSTHRVLFSVEDSIVAAVRRTLAEPLIRWTRNTRTASLPAWPIALLFYIEGEPLPFLGWFFDDGDVYFVDESDPWNHSVFEEDGETFRDVFSIPTSTVLSRELSERFGERDPLDQLRRSAQRREDARCGRVSQPRGETFPHLPKARIEPE